MLTRVGKGKNNGYMKIQVIPPVVSEEVGKSVYIILKMNTVYPKFRSMNAK